MLPHQCGPGMGLGQTDAFCTADEDCMSGACGDRQCSGLCSPYYELIGSPDCAKSACSGPTCSRAGCEIETVAVGRCE